MIQAEAWTGVYKYLRTVHQGTLVVEGYRCFHTAVAQDAGFVYIKKKK